MTHIKNIFRFEYILLTFPFVLLLGQSLTNTLAIFYSIFTIYTFFFVKKNNLSYFFKNKFFLLLSLFFLFGFLSSLINFNNYFFFSVKSNISILLSIFFILGIYFNLNNTEIKIDILKYFFYSILITFIIIFGVFIFDLIFSNDYFFNEVKYYLNESNSKPIHRVIFENEIMGSFIIRFYPLLICFSLLFFSKNHYITIVLFFCSIILIFFSFQRIVIVQFFIANILLIIFFKNIRFLILSLLAVIVFSFISFDTYNYLSKGKSLTQNIANQIYDDGEYYIYSRHHQGHYITSFNMIKNNFFFGIGTNQFRYKCSDKEYIYIYRIWTDQKTNKLNEYDSCSTHPHNFFMQIFSENGIFSFILISLMYSLCFIYSLKFKSHNFSRDKIIFLGSSITILTVYFPLIPSHNFYHGWTNIPILIVIGILFYSYKKLKENNLK